MTFPVMIQPIDGGFAATLIGAPDVSATATSREAAIAQLENSIEQRIARGELLSIGIPSTSLSAISGSYRDDPFLQDICDNTYRQRDSEISE